jgi:hypothetical protein
MNDAPENQNQEPTAPPRLVDALRSVHNQKLLVPPSIDEAILGQARARLDGASEKAEVRVVRFPGWGLAAAAAVVLGLGLGFLVNRLSHPPAVIAREDVDRNGRVDILDAFALARKLKQSGAAGTALDLNGDGIVDQRDIDWVAARAVKLHKG